MSNDHPDYPTARRQLIAFLLEQGYRTNPDEVFCPTAGHCWVDVAAVKEQDYWAFEYKSRKDSIRRGLEQCHAYADAFNYVVLVADRYRVTSSPYFRHFKREGFGVWRHDGIRFYQILPPRRHAVNRNAKVVIERQFRHVLSSFTDKSNTLLSNWLELGRTRPNGQSLIRENEWSWLAKRSAN